MDKVPSHITKDMNILKILEKHPETFVIFREHGLGCVACKMARFESIEQGLLAHDYDVENFIQLLNEKIELDASKK